MNRSFGFVSNRAGRHGTVCFLRFQPLTDFDCGAGAACRSPMVNGSLWTEATAAGRCWLRPLHRDPLVGPANIREMIPVDISGKTYRGAFTLNQFDINGDLLAHFAGEGIGLRITAD